MSIPVATDGLAFRVLFERSAVDPHGPPDSRTLYLTGLYQPVQRGAAQADQSPRLFVTEPFALYFDLP
jgi:hypothetical protein